MNKIKCRVWDIVKWGMDYTDRRTENDRVLIFHIFRTGFESGKYINDTNSPCWEFGDLGWEWEVENGTSNLKGGILMEGTGLKDMLGQEIYEEDILQEISPRGNKYRVFRVPGGFVLNMFQDELEGIKTFCEPLAHDQTRSYVETQCKVIGNIYENPELLIKTK